MDDDDWPYPDAPPLEAYEGNVVNMPGVKPRDPILIIDPSQWQGQEPPERRWAVDGMVPYGQASLLTGAGSAGKSLVEQLQCTCVALGLPWLGIQVEQTKALYITCEDDAAELHRRQKAICDGLGVPLSALEGKLYLISLAGMIGNELATFDERGRLAISDRYRDIEERCLSLDIHFVALDNTGHFFSGNENDRHQVASFVGLCNGLAAKIFGSVVIVGHPNKAGGEYSGSTAWENQVRSRLFMEIPSSDDGTVVDPDARVIRRGKSNYAQKGHEVHFRWHKWTFVLNDEMPNDQREAMAATLAATADNSIFLACLVERNKQRRPVSERPSRTYAPTVFNIMPESKGIGKARLEQAMDRLFRTGQIKRDVLWHDGHEGKDAVGLKVTGSAPDNDPLTPDNATPSTPANAPANDPTTTANAQKSARQPISANAPDNDSANHPLTPANAQSSVRQRPANTPLPLKGEGLEPSPHRGDTEPPPWMDEPPPRDLDWRDNPILNDEWPGDD